VISPPTHVFDIIDVHRLCRRWFSISGVGTLWSISPHHLALLWCTCIYLQEGSLLIFQEAVVDLAKTILWKLLGFNENAPITRQMLTNLINMKEVSGEWHTFLYNCCKTDYRLQAGMASLSMLIMFYWRTFSFGHCKQLAHMSVCDQVLANIFPLVVRVYSYI